MTGVLLAVAGAIGYGLASVLEAAAARSSGGALRAIARPRYVFGLVLDLVAWLASLAALRTLPVFEVQAILAGSLAVTAVLGWLVLGHPLRRIDAAAIAVTVIALAAVVAGSVGSPAARPRAGTTLLLVGTAMILAVAGLVASRGSAAIAAVVAGLAFGGAALCARDIDLHGGDLLRVLTSVLGQPSAWALALFGVTGILLYANALERGGVASVTALLWIAEVVVPAIAGMLLFGDRVPGHRVFFVVPALAMALGAAVVLAGS